MKRAIRHRYGRSSAGGAYRRGLSLLTRAEKSEVVGDLRHARQLYARAYEEFGKAHELGLRGRAEAAAQRLFVSIRRKEGRGLGTYD